MKASPTGQLKLGMKLKHLPQCVVPENTHPLHGRDLPYDPHPSGSSNVASYYKSLGL